MRWKDRRRSENVEDRRGRSPYPRGARVRIPRGGGPGGAQRAGGTSLILFAIVALALWVFAGINPLQLIEIVTRQDGTFAEESMPPRPAEEMAEEDERAAFLSVVLAETEEAWTRIFRERGYTYDPPTMVLYSGFTPSACGLGSAAVGPFYCPMDERVYIDLSFFDILARRFDAPGDFAQAYVLAHEVGHHVQNQTGMLQRYHEERRRRGERATRMTGVMIELQADCYAGVWAHYADRIGILEEGDIEEAMTAAAAVGDDMVQRREQGYAVPETFSHGSARQRTRWFRRGYRTGDPAECDTLGEAL